MLGELSVALMQLIVLYAVTVVLEEEAWRLGSFGMRFAFPEVSKVE